MPYRCAMCKGVVPSDQPRCVHVVRAADGSGIRELPVCAACKAVLESSAKQPTNNEQTGGDQCQS